MIGLAVDSFLHALIGAAPFEQWRSVGASDLVYLAPWALLIWLLVPKNRESEPSMISWKTVLFCFAGGIMLLFLALVVYYLLSAG